MADNGVEFELAEACLAHAVGNAVVQAYQRSSMSERRRPIMQAWASFLTGDRQDRRQGRIHRLAPEAAMIRIAISPAAFDAVAATLPVGSVAVEAEANERGERYVWLEERWLNKLDAMRRPDETYSHVILRLVGMEGSWAP